MKTEKELTEVAALMQTEKTDELKLRKQVAALMQTEKTEILIETENPLFTSVSLSLSQCLNIRRFALMQTEKTDEY
jgi:hypothetical protein